jgi:hypothetical protein
METTMQNIEMIIVAAALISNFIISLSKKDIKWFNPKVDDIIKEVQLNRRYSLLSLIYSNAPVLSRMYALLEYIKLGFNHEAIEWSVIDFIIYNQQLWWTAVNEDKDTPIKDMENYKICMNRIRDILIKKGIK